MVISPASSSHSADSSLAAAIGDAGRRMSPRNLGLILLCGSIAVVVTLWLWRGHRMMAVPLAMPVAFGIWGLAVHGERALETQGPGTKVELALLTALRVVMVAVGIIAAVASMFAITFAVAGQGSLQLR